MSPEPRCNRTTNIPHQSKSSTAHSQFLNEHFHRPTSRSSSPTNQNSTSSYRKGKYSNSRRAARILEGIRASSVRQDRSQMNAKDKDEDQNLVSNSLNKETLDSF